LKQKTKDKLYVLPIVLIVAVVPLIIRYKRIELGEVVASYWIRDYNTDFFSYYKMVFLLGFTILAIISFYIYYKKGNKLKKTFYYYPIAVYMLMAILSTVFSKAQLTSLTGFPDRYEGLPVLLSYMLIMVITINLVNTEEQFKFIINALLTSAVIIALIGLSQFFEMDFFKSLLGRYLILPNSNFIELSSSLKFRNNNNIIFSTLYNPNYAGSYFSMVFVLSTVLYFFEEKFKKKVVLLAVNALMFAAWLGSLSRAGMLGALFAFLILAIILKKEILKRWKSIAVIFLVFLTVFSFMDVYTDGSLQKEFLTLGDETKLALTGETTEIKEIKNEDGALVFNTAEEKLRFIFDELGKLKVYDGEGKLLNLIKLDTHLIFANPKYNNYIFRVIDNSKNDNKIFEFMYGNKRAEFPYNAKLNGFFILGMRNSIYPLEEVQRWGFEGKEMLASKRGYIWSRTIPLLDKALITGYGPDTFAIFFPQEDALGKFIYFNNPKKIVDKPHNIYLQIWVNTGLISLIAILVIFTVYFARNIFNYFKTSFNTYYSRLGLGLFAVFSAYAVAAFFNDSIISVAPVFWTILALGMTVQLKINN